MQSSNLSLKDFRISETTGFLPDSEVAPGGDNGEWHQFAADLPKILTTDRFHSMMDRLPTFKVGSGSREQSEIDMRALSYISHAFLWKASEVPNRLPAKISEPYFAVSEKCGRPPVLSYASYCLYNFRRMDASKPPHLGNINIVSNFLGGLDEDWFILIHVDIEARAAQCMKAIPQLIEDANAGRVEMVESGLAEVVAGLKAINVTMKRMPEACDPYIYYTRVRPYIFGSKNNPSLPDGLIYENCFDGKPQFFRGETGAQSSIVPALDAMLGVEHKNDPLKEYLMEMRDYMVPEHRKFIEAIEAHSKVRQCVEANSSSSGLVKNYNDCIEQIFLFREQHLEYAASYIHNQSSQSNNSTSVGTGGTPFMTYLAKHRDETKISAIQA